MVYFLAFFGFVMMLWIIVTSYRVALYLRNKGVNVNLWLLKVFILKYVRQYKTITIGEMGRPGSLYYHFIIPHIILFLIVGFALIFRVIP